MNEKLLEEMIKDVLLSMTKNDTNSTSKTDCQTCETMTTADYPLQEKHPDLVKTPTGKAGDEITLEKVVNGEITAQDIRIAPETLELQAQVAESAGRTALAKNFRRAAELTQVPDSRILEIYNALRPHRSTKDELLAIADELEKNYGATISANFIREAADVYEERNILRVE